jgi:hypothetical protein
MSRGLGRRQRVFLAALRTLEAEHGARRWFYVHATVRAIWGPLDVAGEDDSRMQGQRGAPGSGRRATRRRC